MGEKRGGTVKLVYDFNTAACLEVQLSNSNWYRITPNEFRSYNRPRRILVKENVYEQYEGPIYIFGTNKIVKDSKKDGIIFLDDVDPRLAYGRERREFGRL